MSVEFLKSLFVISATGMVFACGFSFVASAVYFIVKHPRGTGVYIVKTFAIALIAAPLLVLALFGLVFYAGDRIKAIIVRFVCRKRRKIVDVIEGNFQESDAVVYLVHGTFEPNAAWTFPGSPMWSSIQEENPGVTMARFSWSGGNTNADRSVGAKNLKKTIEKSASKNIYLIGHSHAGNLIKEMMQIAPEIVSKIKGVCLLSTPFIYRKNLERTGGQLTLLHAIGFSSVIQAIAALILFPAGCYNVVSASIVFLASIIVECWLAKRCTKSLSNNQSIGDFSFGNLKILHSIGDEADSGLRTLSTLHEACFGVFAQLRAADQLMKKRIHSPFVICYVLHAAVAVIVSSMAELSDLWLWCVALSFSIIVGYHCLAVRRRSEDVSSFLIMAALPVAISAFYLNALKALAYGDFRLIFCPNTFIYSSETPLGEHGIKKYAPYSDSSLVHSTHSHCDAIKDVAEWVRVSNISTQV